MCINKWDQCGECWSVIWINDYHSYFILANHKWDTQQKRQKQKEIMSKLSGIFCFKSNSYKGYSVEVIKVISSEHIKTLYIVLKWIFSLKESERLVVIMLHLKRLQTEKWLGQALYTGIVSTGMFNKNLLKFI